MPSENPRGEETSPVADPSPALVRPASPGGGGRNSPHKISRTEPLNRADVPPLRLGRGRSFALLLFLLLAPWAPPAFAHKASDSFLSFETEGDRIKGQWDIALRDLDSVIVLDTNQDGEISPEEVRSQRKKILDYSFSRLHVRADKTETKLVPGDFANNDHSDGGYVVIPFSVEGVAGAKEIEIEYDLLFDTDPLHRGLLKVVDGETTYTAVCSPESPSWVFPLARLDVWKEIRSFVREGVFHIWTGYDHILFLLALLLPAVLRRENNEWKVVPSLKPAFLGVLKIVTAFTVAHSVTLTVATLGWVRLPSRFVESVIAASVVLAAVNNLKPLVSDRSWLVAFTFGLIHGFGFASVLTDLNLAKGARALALIGFNSGVELGQLVIVLVFLPLAFLLRRSWFYRRLTLQFGSVAIACVALAWMFERILDVKWLR